MTLFLSTFIHKIDKKGRVSVPLTFRQALSQTSFQGFVAYRSYKHAAIEGCSFNRMFQLSSSIDTLDAFSDTQDDFATTIFADAVQIPFDGDGRIILPPSLLSHGHITDHIAFVGRGATFQLWEPNQFTMLQDAARQRMKAGDITLKLTPGGTS